MVKQIFICIIFIVIIIISSTVIISIFIIVIIITIIIIVVVVIIEIIWFLTDYVPATVGGFIDRNEFAKRWRFGIGIDKS